MFDPVAQGVATVVLGILGAYVLIGVAFALWFVIRGVTGVDHAAVGSRWHFRMLIVPGVVALWPVMMVKMKNASGGAKPQA